MRLTSPREFDVAFSIDRSLDDQRGNILIEKSGPYTLSEYPPCRHTGLDSEGRIDAPQEGPG